ncbi:hypothetical protein LCGC14_0354850 [marine sediment metagenome]|uniref:Uncharacterized protein n=1 Tax=marine sediment metagenome TaxID=412755 RepID=A0A0F9T9M8_9ZZZZ
MNTTVTIHAAATIAVSPKRVKPRNGKPFWNTKITIRGDDGGLHEINVFGPKDGGPVKFEIK